MQLRQLLGTFCAMTLVAASAQAVMVAGEDFDGGDLNLTSSNVPDLDGGAGDDFRVGSLGSWPNTGGVPFSLADDSVVSIGGSVFSDDNEGVFGQNAPQDNNFFGMSDSDEFGSDQTASWTFDVAGYSDLVLKIDMAGISNDSFDGYSIADTSIIFTVSIDGGTAQTAFAVSAVANDGQFTTRLMDSGNASGGGALLQVSGDNLVTKLLAEDGTAAADTFLDKSVVADGSIDTFMTDLNGTGDELVLTMTANMPFEAAAFDNIVISSSVIPEPASLALLSLGGLMIARRRRA
jgi:hypothetical protein